MFKGIVFEIVTLDGGVVSHVSDLVTIQAFFVKNDYFLFVFT